VARGGGTGMETMGREAALERGGRVGSVSREWTSGHGHTLRGSVGDAAAREKKEREGGLAAGVARGAGRHRGAWPRPAGGAPIVSWPAVTRTRRTGADMGGPRWQ
jgi:hypothetical protein